MKALVTVAALLVSSSAFAVLQDHYSCQNATGEIIVSIETTNRPDFEIEKYDSASADAEANEGVGSLTNIGGNDVEARIQTVAYKGGTINPIQEADDQGRTCTIGSDEQGAQLKINLTAAGQTQTVDLTCSIVTDLPRGAVECE